MPASPLSGGEARSCACHPLHTAPTILRRPTTHSTSLTPELADNGRPCPRPVATLHCLFSPRPSRARTNVLFEIQTALYLRLRQLASVIMPAWYQWATLPAAAMRPACVVSVQYFLCDRKAIAFRMDDTIPAISVQTSTIVPPVHMLMRKSLPEISDGLASSSCKRGYGSARVLCPTAVLVVIKHRVVSNGADGPAFVIGHQPEGTRKDCRRRCRRFP